MKIGELAARTGVSERSLRYYEQQGLVSAERTEGGHRVYPEAAVARVIRIQELLAAGLSTARIGELLPCMRDADGAPAAHATPRLLATLHTERDRIDASIKELHRAREVLGDIINTAARPDPSP
jgi:DNA-binding transcriptional MerR regulator